MMERFKSIEEKQKNEKSLEERLERYPVLKARVESILAVVENTAGDLEKANAVEQRVIEEMRKMGNEVLHNWAESQEHKKSEGLKEREQAVKRKCKKNSIGTHNSERYKLKKKFIPLMVM